MEKLIAHIKKINAKTEAWVAIDPANRWAGVLCDDPKHWEKCGIDTPERLDAYLDSEYVKELAEDLY